MATESSDPNDKLRPAPGDPGDSGKSRRPRGEDEHLRGQEPGRFDGESEGPTERPTGQSTARDSTSIDPQDPIDPRSPNLR
jgi:hypothetical protein